MLRADESERPHRLSRMLDWWHETRERWARMAELRDLPPGELDRVAADFGVSPLELLEASTKSDSLLSLLDRRLEALHLDPEDIRKISPMLLRDLQHTCSKCPEQKRCLDDMAVSPLMPGWESYCPNSGTLRTLS